MGRREEDQGEGEPVDRAAAPGQGDRKLAGSPRDLIGRRSAGKRPPEILAKGMADDPGRLASGDAQRRRSFRGASTKSRRRALRALLALRRDRRQRRAAPRHLPAMRGRDRRNTGLNLPAVLLNLVPSLVVLG